MRGPSSPAKPAAAATAISDTRRVLMPLTMAASLSSEDARQARPTRLCLLQTSSAIGTATATAMRITSTGSTYPPAIFSGVIDPKKGTWNGCVPHKSEATPSSIIPVPMVVINSACSPLPSTGRMATLSSITPRENPITKPNRNPSATGRCSCTATQ